MEDFNFELNSAQGTASASREPRKPRIEKARIEQNFGKTQKEAAANLGVHISTLKRYCRAYGIKRWPSHKIKSVSHTMRVKATYRRHSTVLFDIIDIKSINFEELCKKLGMGFGLVVGSFKVEYEDNVGDWVMITETGDLREHINDLHLSEKNMDLRVLINKDQPVKS